MPLPEKVIEQLGREPVKTPGWAFGVVMFSGALLFLMLVIYFGIIFGYEPYLAAKIQQKQDQITSLGNSVSPNDQANLLNFYSQISNLRTLLRKHAVASQLFSWLEKNTETNVYFTSFAFANNQLQIQGVGKTQADVAQQIAIFEASPQVRQANVSNVSAATNGAGWQFSALVNIDPSMLVFGGLGAAASPASAPSSLPSRSASSSTATTTHP